MLGEGLAAIFARRHLGRHRVLINGGPNQQLAAGDPGQLAAWLRDNLYSLGRKLTPKETLERLTGSGELDPEPYLAYLRGKVGAPA